MKFLSLDFDLDKTGLRGDGTTQNMKNRSVPKFKIYTRHWSCTLDFTLG